MFCKRCPTEAEGVQLAQIATQYASQSVLQGGQLKPKWRKSCKLQQDLLYNLPYQGCPTDAKGAQNK